MRLFPICFDIQIKLYIFYTTTLYNYFENAWNEIVNLHTLYKMYTNINIIQNEPKLKLYYNL